MPIKKEYLALLVVIVGASLYLYFNQTDRLNYRLPQPPTLDRAEIAGLEIDRPGEAAVTLEKKAAGWRVRPGDYAADTDTVRAILDEAAELTLTALISESEDYHRYQLTPDKSLTVSVLAENDSLLRKIQVGKSAASHQHTFVRLGDDSRVYHARGRLRRVFDKSAAELRDKTVLSFDVDDIRKIEITGEETDLSLVKQAVDRESAGGDQTGDQADDQADDQTGESGAGAESRPEVWLDASSRSRADQSAVKEWLTTLSSLECRSFMEEAESKDLADPVYTVRLIPKSPPKEDSKEATHALSLFSPADPQTGAAYRGTSSGAAEPFLIPAHQAGIIMKGAGEFTDAAPNK